ncbi:MAG: UDP-2,4-diacetamido-2,4,6-trideoxy-beta-L-altropyranose hydrolase [Bacteriovorax sp.]|nr:UDP-2,4-diacetamido-2,4,6-trideoxy-beta-L-altropyranose hydrolase [Bacteriovorax sp.]
MRKVVFRVDSGIHIGMGHVMRCLTLAYEFKSSGWEVIFITKDHLGFSEELISKNYQVFVIEGGVKHELPPELKNDYESWLGDNWKNDLEKTNHTLESLGKVELVVIDNYALDENYEKLVKAERILVIDDLMNRKHCCDFLLNQNSSSNEKTYTNLTAQKKSRLFLGPSFSLLRREFSDLRALNYQQRLQKFKIKNILVFFGAGDVAGCCQKVANSLTEKELTQYRFTFILNESHPSFKALLNWTNEQKSVVKVLSYVENMAQLITEHDFFIGAGGSTSWERVCLGIPSAIISVSDNQVQISETLVRDGLIHYLGEAHDVDNKQLREFFESVLIQSEVFYKMSQDCFKVTDGKGASKLVQEISGAWK